MVEDRKSASYKKNNLKLFYCSAMNLLLMSLKEKILEFLNKKK